MPDYSPFSLTKNPFDPSFVEPNHLLTVPVGPKAGLDHLSSKVADYENKLKGFSATDLHRHFVCVTGPSKGGRSTFLKLLTAKLDAHLIQLKIDTANLYRYASHPETQMNNEEGPNAALKNILRGLLVNMKKNASTRFDVKAIDDVFAAVVKAKELDDISNAFVGTMDLSLSALEEPLLLLFENLSSSGLYTYLRQTFLNIPAIIMITAYSNGPVAADFRTQHGADPLAWWTDLEPVDCDEIFALTEFNLNRARAPKPGIHPFDPKAIEGFFSGGVQRQPMGRLMNACFHSIELKAEALQQDKSAPPIIRFEDMQEALKRR